MPQRTDVDLVSLLEDVDDTTREEFAPEPRVEKWDSNLLVGNLPIEARRFKVIKSIDA